MSYSPVYSAAFIQYTPQATNTEFEVPQGFTAVIRQISILCTAGAVAGGVYIADDASAPPNWLAYANDIGVLTQFQQEGRWVASEGALIVLALSSLPDTASAYVGGYLLTNTVA